MNTTLIISLGITLVFCTLIYYFLRKRINSVDQKVNLLMQLVKEHHAQVQNQSQIIMQEKNYHTSNLIPVSEDDYDDEEDDIENDRETSYSSDDSAEVSDTESVIDVNTDVVELTNLGDSINLESISLTGAETTPVFESLPVSELTEFEQHNTDNLDELDITLDEVSLDDMNTDSVNMGDDEATKTINLSNIETVDIRKLNVSDLKNKCKEMGLEGYSSLRKQQLVELIESQTATIGDNA
tara:strand:+ start:4149 stop:4868 length:720 start_codon:yes stop_codon:yes gene_type:complete